ncbi:MAG: GNAT family N-acetyltransferase [Clostridiales bacterium]|nr:GNAT family N-acetyltransferase [Clostridiales bacterium]
MMLIREAQSHDLQALLALYTQLHGNEMSAMDSAIGGLWNNIMTDQNHHVIVGLSDDLLVCSCVLITMPNLTHQQRPYALIENVITHEEHRNKGYASALLDFAKQLAMNQNCYKIMLMTSSKKEETLRFYEKAGFNREDKTAFIQWL